MAQSIVLSERWNAVSLGKHIASMKTHVRLVKVLARDMPVLRGYRFSVDN